MHCSKMQQKYKLDPNRTESSSSSKIKSSKKFNLTSSNFINFSPGVVLILFLASSSFLPHVFGDLSHSTTTNHHHHRRHSKRSGGRELDPTPRVESYIGNLRATGPFSAYQTVGVDDLRYSSQGNEYKPIFTMCQSYRPEIMEGQPINTPVIQVRAFDRDDINKGGDLTYSIVETSDADNFIVDNKTGWIKTNKIFDRDEPAREKIAYVSVRATDNGRPPLDDVCNLQVKILDINDNKPMFDKFATGQRSRRKEYRESIPRDLSVGQVVMRISATDIDDGNNGSVIYSLQSKSSSPSDLQYFQVIADTGEVKLVQKFPDSKSAERDYFIVATATDRGSPPELSRTDLTIRVTEPNQKPPSFVEEYPVPFRIKELTHDSHVVTLEAMSGIENNSLVFFELVNGQTQATNKDSIFTQEPSGNNLSIRVEKQLDYELVNEYTLTVRVINKHELAASTVIRIQVEDENDERPFFTDVKQGSVLESEPEGTLVMRVQAIDKDGTSPNNLVTYSLSPEHLDDFSIDSSTGEIRTMRKFDREAQDIYRVSVIARDGAPSAYNKHGEDTPNERKETIKIEIADKNDNPPKFDEAKEGFKAEIAENADIGNVVIEVKATDPDTESVITYTIDSGDPSGNFAIKSTLQGGIVTVRKNLDYETVQNYTLSIRASDSIYSAFTTVFITVLNVNDNKPRFEPIAEKNKTIEEETTPTECIFRVRAYDPDISDRSLPQNISYSVDKKVAELFSVDNDGCVRVIKPLDRDPPTGLPFYQAFIFAHDEWGNSSTSLSEFVELFVYLTDKNDNAPFLSSQNPVVWYENQPAGKIGQLKADDYDEPQNGAPYTYHIPSSASDEIKNSFEIIKDSIFAKRDNFDREKKKEYYVPIQITDSGHPPMTNISFLRVIIGDQNDSPMSDGDSSIFVYKYKGSDVVTIGRVYVRDEDDWDIKKYSYNGSRNDDFPLDPETGMLSMRQTAHEGTHVLRFVVNDYENIYNRFEQASATVTVTVKQISDEAIDNSGSIRFIGLSQEEFIKPLLPDGSSRRDVLRREISKILGIPEENVDVFTVNNPLIAQDLNVVDVRFSAHNSPYWKAEKIEGLLAPYKQNLEKMLSASISMIRVDECLIEKSHCGPEGSCRNVLNRREMSYAIFTNTSSFVGVDSFITPECSCEAEVRPNPCLPNPCLYGGSCRSGPTINGFQCECGSGYGGKRCEKTSISFDGKSLAWFPPITSCSSSSLSLSFASLTSNGLLLYNGPTYKTTLPISDFMSLELQNGNPIFLMDFGSGVVQLRSPLQLADAKDHKISLRWTKTEISMTIDECPLKESKCYIFASPEGSHEFLNVNSPLQLGGLTFDPMALKSSFKWRYVPTTTKFTGCISNITLNDEYYDLSDPSYSVGNITSCDSPHAEVVAANLGVGLNFIIILIICLLLLLLLVMSIFIWRRRRNYEDVKGGESGDEVRENILHYSDEGGGEQDHAGYDLSVFPIGGNGPYLGQGQGLYGTQTPLKGQTQGQNGTIGPDMGTFLSENKDKIDSDPDGLPSDDVRNYAYEGDGTSLGSLSSLASGTDDEDLAFDYLPSFGPRFKKLADIYGGDESEEETTPHYSNTRQHPPTHPTHNQWC